MQTELQIGQVANLLGITPKTIRHYHKLGILPPPKRAENGYRIYSVQSLYRINLIKSLKQIGFSLQDIKVIVDAESPDDALRFKLDEVLKTTQTQVAELQARQKAIKHLNTDNKIIASSEHWKVYEALISYLIAIKKIKQEYKIDEGNFRLFKFLNDVPTYSKDKQGINITILIIQILFLLQNGKYGEIIDRTESLKTYVHRYLRRDHTFRSNCFIKMLLCLPAASFHKAGVIRKAKKYVDLLKSVPIENANQSPEVEIIEYETLWEFVLESLDNKFH